MASEDATWGGEEHEGADAAQLQPQPSEDQADDHSAPNSHVPSDSVDVGADDEDDAEDGGDYDPESISFDPAPQAPDVVAPPAPPAQPAKPKMTGGFLVEVSDDEEDAGASEVPQVQVQAPAQASQDVKDGAVAAPPASSTSSAVLPMVASLDPVAMLEARVKEDPRGDMDAWMNLMADHKRRGGLDALRNVYGRFLEVFPQAADVWVEWIETELGLDNFMEAERLFGKSLMGVLNVNLWTLYLNYIRRRNDLTNDATGQARRTVAQSYDFVIDNIGSDRDSGTIWQDYINFVKGGPGQVGGTGWQDQQKMDQLRKAYQRGIDVPMSTVNNLWKEYDQFEMGLNKVTGRKFIQERSPGYMSAKSANIALDNIMRVLRRTNLARLPPAPAFDGHDEFQAQVEMWKRWIAWEKDDPLVLKDDDNQAYKERVLYCYKQALMALRFWPEMWVDAAGWCLENDVRDGDGKPVGTELLLQGIAANPESVLLALKHADHIEINYPEKDGDKTEYAKAVRQPYDALLDTLYKMGDKIKEREKLEVGTLKQAASQEPVRESIEEMDDDDGDDDDDDDDDDDEGRGEVKKAKKTPTEERIMAIQSAYAAESQLLSRTISYVWIALARAMRRIQGKGNQSEGGLRKVFTDARQKGRLTSDVYVAVARLESVVYKDPVGAKIFERGARLFPNDEGFMIEYIKYLHAKDDTTNARVVFETCVNRLIAKAETLPKAKPLYAYFHKYESQYGELSQISKLEARMAELFPSDPKLSHFTARFSTDKFDPVAAPIIISKAVQMRPRRTAPTIERPMPRSSMPPSRQERSPRPQFARATASPKRPFAMDDDEGNPSKRLARAVSPLKGAAGRRLDQQRRNQSSALHRDITFLLGILPPAHSYDGPKLKPAAAVSLLRDTQLPDYSSWRAKTGGQYRTPAQTLPRPTVGEYGGGGGGYRNSPLASSYAPPEAGAAPVAWSAVQGAYGAPPPPAQFGGYRY
ncbi:hypothetical protein RJ55_08618 [Drechmeria coniospora]|nr:hypothetical protein RJ55_08618 [Drechmeria coniospora]